EWHRTFAGRPLVSYQPARPDGLLAERMGAQELRFRLSAVDGGLVYQSVSAALCLGPLRLPLPHGSTPWVSAWEKPGDAAHAVNVHVEVRLPLVGTLLVYEGRIQVDEGPP